MKSYREKNWREFRDEVIELDGNVCTRCGKGPADKKTLIVHHKSYLKDRKPWDYPYDMCETLCMGCHAIEHGKIPPDTGWEFCDQEDLGDLVGECEYCGHEIRYVFYVWHPKWRVLGVGTNCCDNITGTSTASDTRKYISRREKFIKSRRWNSRYGIHAITQKGIIVNITKEDNGKFQLHLTIKKTGKGLSGKNFYSTVDEAKEKLYDVIENGKAEAAINKYGEI